MGPFPLSFFVTYVNLFFTTQDLVKILIMEKYIDVNGQSVLDLTPDHNRPLAVVDLKVLEKLTNLLPKNSFGGIRHGLREQIMMAENLEQLVAVCEDFSAFHHSVNLIKSVLKPDEVNQEIEPTVKVVGHIDLDDLDRYPRDHSEY